MRTADRFGSTRTSPEFSFAAVMARLREVIRVIEPADSVERYTPWAWTSAPATTDRRPLDRRDRRGAAHRALDRDRRPAPEPLVPPIPGLEQSGYLTSDTMWDALATARPRRACSSSSAAGRSARRWRRRSGGWARK
jgi:hypothetical protein